MTSAPRPPDRHLRPADVDAELDFHVEMQTRRFMADGLEYREARRRALDRIGDMQDVRAACAALALEEDAMTARGWGLGLRQDLPYSWRALWRTPIVTMAAIVTLAIGIGAATSMVSVFDAVLLRPLPYAHADRVVMVWNSYPQLPQAAIAAAEFADIQDAPGHFDAVAAISPQALNLIGGCAEGATCAPERVHAYAVSPILFDLLGARVALGRGFNHDEGRTSSSSVVILTDALWRRRFGSSPDVIGRAVNLGGGAPATVVGVMPPGVRFPDEPLGFLRERADLWIAYDWTLARESGRGNQNLGMVARLGDGLALSSARDQLAMVEGRFKAAFPNRYAGEERQWRMAAVPLRDQMVGAVRPALVVMLGAVGLVLLIACANVANLLLARGATRARDLAVRSALGATRLRLVRQLIVEAGVLAACGTAGGGLLAVVGIALVQRIDPGGIPGLQSAGLDVRVLTFSIALMAVVAMVIGLLPALRLSRTGPAGTLSDASARGGAGRPVSRRVRRALVVAEVALAVIVLVAAGVLTRSLAALKGTPTGFDGSRTVTFQLSPTRASYGNADGLIALHGRVVDRLAALPGVTLASAGYPLPMSGQRWSGSFGIEGRPVPEGQPEPHAELASVMPGYFEAVGIALLEGRGFAATDRRGAPSVVVVDEALARTHWPGESAIGKRLDTDGRTEDPVATVVGVVRHVRNGGPRDDGEPQIYLSLLQAPQRLMFYVARTTGDPRPLIASVRAAVREVDPNLPVEGVAAMDDLTGRMLAADRFNTTLLVTFAGVALLLALVGLYGVLSYLVAERHREIGIRLALGGRPGHVLRHVFAEGLAMTGTGLALGLAASAALADLLAGLVFGVTVIDPTTYAGIAAVLGIAAMAAMYGPAVRATRVDPVDALRR